MLGEVQQMKGLFFFFQAEDGIRDYKVTGVQTCALPISRREGGRAAERNPRHGAVADQPAARLRLCAALSVRDRPLPCRISAARGLWRQIGRASCRERV